MKYRTEYRFLTEEEARAEARRRWGPKGDVVYVTYDHAEYYVYRYQVGYWKEVERTFLWWRWQDKLFMDEGSSERGWEEAFEYADQHYAKRNAANEAREKKADAIRRNLVDKPRDQE